MKRIFTLVTILLVLALVTNAQIRKVPAEVTNTFSSLYPTAKNVTWKDNLTNFEAQFDLSGNHTVAKFNSKGEWMETERDMIFKNLNAAIKDGFNKSKYNDWQRKEVKELQNKSKETLFRIYVSKTDLQKKYLYFNVEGQLVKDAVTF